jgi:cell division protein FtsB
VTRGRWAVIAGLILALYFALQGGEYSTLDLLQLRREEAAEQANVAKLQRTVDSLERESIAIERNPRMQERVARESFGMIRRGEFLYKIVSQEPIGGGER